MLLMIDNYDSFTYNLVQYLGELGQDVRVVRNDQIALEGIEALKPTYLVLSPGPCTPAEAGVCVPAIRHFAGKLPILGVCLGHQSIGAALGGRIVRAGTLMHGKTSVIRDDGRGVFAGLPERRTNSRSARRRKTMARSWPCGTAALPERRRRSRACSSTPSRSSASTAMRC